MVIDEKKLDKEVYVCVRRRIPKSYNFKYEIQKGVLRKLSPYTNYTHRDFNKGFIEFQETKHLDGWYNENYIWENEDAADDLCCTLNKVLEINRQARNKIKEIKEAK